MSAHDTSDRQWQRLAWVLAAFMLVAAACTSSSAESGSEGDPADTTTQVPIPEQPESPEREAVRALEGQLAVIDGHELLVTPPTGSDPVLISGSDVEVASQPTWSPDGSRLGWALDNGATSAVAVGVPGAEPLVSPGFGTTPFYLAWDDAGSSLAYLRPEDNGARFETGTLIPGEDPIAGEAGAPLYLSWRPDGVDLALHADADRIELSEPPAAAIPVSSTEGQFATPVWLDDQQLLILENNKLVLLDVESKERRELLEIGDVTRFVLSPDRSRLAYLTVRAGTQTVSLAERQEATPPEVRLRVFDFASGRDLLVADEEPMAFEWSPNSALLSWLGRIDRTQMQWHIWSSAGEFTTLSPYEPSVLDQSAYLPFFDQYVQSQNRWEPNGQAMVFAGTVGPTSGVWVQLIDSEFGPFLVADGDYATWSPPPGGGGGGASIL